MITERMELRAKLARKFESLSAASLEKVLDKFFRERESISVPPPDESSLDCASALGRAMAAMGAPNQ
jgi:hypothetical protein